jgi:hypothetical protein
VGSPADTDASAKPGGHADPDADAHAGAETKAETEWLRFL